MKKKVTKKVTKAEKLRFDLVNRISEEHIRAIASMLGSSIALKFGGLLSENNEWHDCMMESYMIDENEVGGLDMTVRLEWVKKDRKGKFVG
jgi:hypothetical protein